MRLGTNRKQEVRTANRRWPASCSDLASSTLRTTIERRTPFSTVNHTGGETTVVLGLQQLWSDAKSNRKPCCGSHFHIFCIWNPNISQRSVWGSFACGNRISDVSFLIVFLSNHESVLLSFRDMTRDGQRTTDRRRQSSHVWPLAGQQ